MRSRIASSRFLRECGRILPCASIRKVLGQPDTFHRCEIESVEPISPFWKLRHVICSDTRTGRSRSKSSSLLTPTMCPFVYIRC